MDELIYKLSKKQKIAAVTPEKTPEELYKRIYEYGFVHITFISTGTEIGIKLEETECQYNKKDLERGEGLVHLAGYLTLNYNKVKCIADIDIKTCEGYGYLELVENRLR